MDETPRSGYGEQIAELYDDWFGSYLDAAPVADRLAELAGEGPVLELGIGTGRIALRLVERGIDVHGIDASPAMVAEMRAKPGGSGIPVTIGDFTDVSLDQQFSLAYVVAGTFFELQSQEAQVRCFRSVAGALRPGGVFVLDALVPDSSRSGDGQDIKVLPGPADRLVLRVRQINPAEQRYVSHYVIVEGGTVRHVSVAFRYAWPSELDLMAQLAGLRLRQRFGGWGGEPYSAGSRYHVSLYELPATPEDDR